MDDSERKLRDFRVVEVKKRKQKRTKHQLQNDKVVWLSGRKKVQDASYKVKFEYLGSILTEDGKCDRESEDALD